MEYLHVSGILFNHESPRRGETFVTRKITRFLTRKILRIRKRFFIFRKHICKKRLGSCKRLYRDAMENTAAKKTRRFYCSNR